MSRRQTFKSRQSSLHGSASWSCQDPFMVIRVICFLLNSPLFCLKDLYTVKRRLGEIIESPI